MSGMSVVLSTLSKPGARAQSVATVICILTLDGALLGELEERLIRNEDEVRTVRYPPAAWFGRLANAIERGAIDKMRPAAIAERILTVPEEAK